MPEKIIAQNWALHYRYQEVEGEGVLFSRAVPEGDCSFPLTAGGDAGTVDCAGSGAGCRSGARKDGVGCSSVGQETVARKPILYEDQRPRPDGVDADRGS